MAREITQEELEIIDYYHYLDYCEIYGIDEPMTLQEWLECD